MTVGQVAGLYYSFPFTGNKAVPVSIEVFPFGASTIVVSSMDIVWAIETGTRLAGHRFRKDLTFNRAVTRSC